ncbi:MAG: hypothetical protein AB7T49_13155 [Oligoflexales bacterium]
MTMQIIFPRFRIILLAALCVGGTPRLLADDIDMEGRVRVQVESNALKKGNMRYEGKIDIESKRREGTKGVLTLKARSKDSTNLFLEEAYVDHRFAPGKLQLGQIKKQFGLEYELSEKKRFTIERSPIYQKLQPFAYVGFEPAVRYEHLPSEPGELSYATTFGYSGSQEPYAIFYLHPNTNDTQYAAWTLLQGDRLNNATQLVGAFMFSVWNHEKPQSFEMESIVGLDPFETAVERDISGRKVVFSGLKISYGPWFATGGDTLNTQAVAQVSHIMHDMKTPEYATSQLLLGINRHINEHFLVAADIELIAKNSRQVISERNYDDSNIKVQVEYYL